MKPMEDIEMSKGLRFYGRCIGELNSRSNWLLRQKKIRKSEVYCYELCTEFNEEMVKLMAERKRQYYPLLQVMLERGIELGKQVRAKYKRDNLEAVA